MPFNAELSELSIDVTVPYFVTYGDLAAYTIERQ